MYWSQIYWAFFSPLVTLAHTENRGHFSQVKILNFTYLKSPFCPEWYPHILRASFWDLRGDNHSEQLAVPGGHRQSPPRAMLLWNSAPKYRSPPSPDFLPAVRAKSGQILLVSFASFCCQCLFSRFLPD